jgi:hypothetical protein
MKPVLFLTLGSRVAIPYWYEDTKEPSGYAEATVVEILPGGYFTCQVSHNYAAVYSREELAQYAQANSGN